ncbi:MAG: DUF3592 domain-containing protein [Anaerolineales bacterium]|nr:DUF3592 domain-containing protein [Anaerolineales bacterium]
MDDYRQYEEPAPRRSGGFGCLLLGALNLMVVGMLAATVFFGWRSYRLYTGGERTIAHVVRMVSSSDSEGDCCVYSPVFEYTVEGQQYGFESRNASSPPAYQVGQQVEILYNPEDPNDAVVNSFFEMWLVTALLCPSTLFTAVAVNGFWFLRSRLKKTNTEVYA